MSSAWHLKLWLQHLEHLDEFSVLYHVKWSHIVRYELADEPRYLFSTRT